MRQMDTPTAEALPLATDHHGVVKVGGTRVTLDTVVYAFQLGASAEEIALRYPALTLADGYAAISYYLHHSGEVDEYLRRRERAAGEVRRENEARFDSAGVRERLRSRQTR